MPVLTSYDGSKDDIANMGTAGKVAQSFKIPATALADSIDFYGGKGTVGTQPGTFKFEIVEGGFNGTVIATTNTVSTSGYANWDVAPAWHNLALTVPVTLNIVNGSPVPSWSPIALVVPPAKVIVFETCLKVSNL
jgi:hypothetical protein